MAASKIIGMLISHKFDFRKVHVEAQASYHLLQANKNEFAWNVFTPELIPFDEWFFSFISNNNLYKQINYGNRSTIG